MFEVDATNAPYHVKSYRIPVLHMPLMKSAINKMIANYALEVYDGPSRLAAPAFGIPKRTKR